jgi:hypothetical protein
MLEFCANIKPFMQPHPAKNPRGDCFACSLTAALQHLFLENPPAFDDVWNYFMQKYYMSDEKGLDCGWTGMEKAIQSAYADGYHTDHEFDLVMPKPRPLSSNIFYENYFADDYTRRLEGWLRSGWIAITDIYFAGGGARDTWNGQFHGNDHFILLDGTREVWERLNPDGSARQLKFYIHVICSVKGAYWIEANELMKSYGAAGWWLIRKADEDR